MDVIIYEKSINNINRNFDIFLNMCIRYIPENYYILVSDNQVSEEEKKYMSL